MQDAWQAYSELLAYEDRIHLACTVLNDPGDERQRTEMRERNIHILATLDALEERRGDIDEESPLVQELARIDNKLNVLMDIVTRLLVPDSTLPARVDIRMNAVGAVLPSGVVPAKGERILLRLHVDALRALPLEFAAQRQAGPAGDSAFLVFEPMGDALREAFERFVFRHHRRKVAEARQSLT
ncbi:MAG TPA: PilZ domain-containing protein [Dyella sp.]|uniref:PilZ domain-containing protein n=1 Tax=Dyella sp. TaxID=1869338 RepID=UPI002F92950B